MLSDMSNEKFGMIRRPFVSDRSIRVLARNIGIKRISPGAIREIRDILRIETQGIFEIAFTLLVSEDLDRGNGQIRSCRALTIEDVRRANHLLKNSISSL